jgi:prepilin peptidase CpaA
LVPASDFVVPAALLAGLGCGAVIDMRERRIPNVVSVATAVIGVALAASGLSGVTLASSLLGLAAGFALMLPGHIFGGTGAGDVKLFAAAGTLLGTGRIVPAFLFVAIAGGALAVLVAIRRGRLTRTVTMVARLIGRPADAKEAIEAPVEHNRFSFGPAIAIGCLIAALTGA